MRASKLELMHDHVRAIHRAVTGGDLPEAVLPEDPTAAPDFGRLTQRFAELEALARALPFVAERVPPFSFAPPFDVIGTERETIVELGVPGIDRESVNAELEGNRLVVTGVRGSDKPLDGRIYFHAELPRGPFRREVTLPVPSTGRPRIEIDNGIIRVRVARQSKAPLPQA